MTNEIRLNCWLMIKNVVDVMKDYLEIFAYQIIMTFSGTGMLKKGRNPFLNSRL